MNMRMTPQDAAPEIKERAYAVTQWEKARGIIRFRRADGEWTEKLHEADLKRNTEALADAGDGTPSRIDISVHTDAGDRSYAGVVIASGGKIQWQDGVIVGCPADGGDRVLIGHTGTRATHFTGKPSQAVGCLDAGGFSVAMMQLEPGPDHPCMVLKRALRSVEISPA